MHIQSISIKNFRNIVSAMVYPCAKVNILHGENAQGKTNFLESIYVSSHGKSFRQGEQHHLISHTLNPQSYAQIELTIEKKNLINQIKFNISAHEKHHYLNEKKNI